MVTSQSDAPSCGTTSSRFGCCTCTVADKDRSLQGFADAVFRGVPTTHTVNYHGHSFFRKKAAKPVTRTLTMPSSALPSVATPWHTYQYPGGGSYVKVDCETETTVYEGGLDKRSSLDSVQQALFFAHLTGKKPAVYDTDGRIGRFEHHIKTVCEMAGVGFVSWPFVKR